MRIVLQRVTSASVKVDGNITGKIDTGFLLLFGVGHEDTEEDCRRLADKISGLRIFSDENDKINLDLSSVGGKLLVVPQFTLYADCRKGRRPGFSGAAAPETADPLYRRYSELLKENGVEKVERGIFGADMLVRLENDGPATFLLESK